MKQSLKFLIVWLLSVAVTVAAGATNLTLDQIMNNAYDSTTGTLKLSLSVGTQKDSTSYTNVPSYPLILQHETSGTPASGIGVGLSFLQETSANNNETVLKQAAIMTDVTAASEDADWVLSLMKAGAAASEALRVTSTGVLSLINGETIDNTTNGTVTYTTPIETHVNSTSATITSPAISLDGGVTINDSSADVDTRIESNGNQNAIFVDAGNDRVGIFTAAPTVPLDVTGNMLLTGDTVLDGGVIINESSADKDTRIESNGNAAAVFVDAGNDRVGIFTAAPTVPFEVTGNALVTGTLTSTGLADVLSVTLGNDETITNAVNGTVLVTATTTAVTGGLDVQGGTITLQNDEVIDNSVDGTITLTSPIVATSAALNVVGALDVQGGNITLQNDEIISNSTDGTVAITSPIMAMIMGTTGGLNIKKAEATSGALSGGTGSIAVNVPSGAIILGTQLRVDTEITFGGGGATWGAIYATGSTATIAANTTNPAKNTKVNKFFDANAATAITTGTTTITVAPNAGTFSAGVVRAITYYIDFTAMADAS